eukprot:jgi/Botrbrau1/22106/Bobra.0206s0032.1
MKVDRRAFEGSILLVTLFKLAYPLWANVPGGCWQAECLLGLTIFSIIRESFTRPGALGYPRRATSQGVAVGALAVPWTFAGLLPAALKHGMQAEFYSFALRASMGASALMLGMLALDSCWRDSLGGQRPRNVVEGSSGAYCADGEGEAEKVPGRARRPVHVTCRTSSSSGGLQWAAPSSASSSVAKSGNRSFLAESAEFTRQSRIEALLSVAFSILLFLCVLRDGPYDLRPAGLRYPVGPWGTTVVSLLAVAGLLLLLFALRMCFTIGEAMVVSTGLALLGWDVFLLSCSASLHLWGSELPRTGQAFSIFQLLEKRSQVSLFCELLVAGVLLGCWSVVPLLRQLFVPPKKMQGTGTLGTVRGTIVGGLAAVLVGGGTLLVIKPAIWALQFAFASLRRAGILAFWVALLAFTLPVMNYLSHSHTVPTIIVRKGYHILALMLFSPALVWEPQLLAISLAIAAAALMVVEAVRVGSVPHIAAHINAFMTSFLDSRDSGAVLISHFSLLAGMAVPVWLSGIPGVVPGEQVPDLAGAFTGIIILGIADSAASAIGRGFGRLQILDTHKTVEGTLGGMVCCLLAWMITWVTCLPRDPAVPVWSAVRIFC